MNSKFRMRSNARTNARIQKTFLEIKAAKSEQFQADGFSSKLAYE